MTSARKQGVKRLSVARDRRARGAIALKLLEDGQVTLLSVLNSSQDALGHVRVYDLLRRAPKLGPTGAERVLNKAKVWPLRRMRELTDEERLAIIRWLPPRVR